MKKERICNNCLVFHKSTVVKGCEVCNKLGFQENILCELANKEKNEKFSCPGFRPFLSLVGRSNKEKMLISKAQESTDKGHSNKIKWFKAYALQQLKLNPDQIHSKINYHVCLVSQGRQNVFENQKMFFENMASNFYDIGVLYESKIHLIGISGDHIHLFIDSSPEYPADTIVNKIIDSLEEEFQKNIHKEKEKGNKVFEKNYFIETVG